MSIWTKQGSLAEKFWQHGNAGFPIYDMHGHMGSHNAIYFKRAEAAEMVAHLLRAGIRRLVFSHHHVLFSAAFRNQQVWEICRSFPDTLRMYVGINPHYPEIIKEDLAQFEQWRPYAVGLKILAGYHLINVTDQRYEYALQFANERRLPVLFHTWGGRGGYNDGPSMLTLAQKYPGITFFIGHSLFGDWEYTEKIIKETPDNCYLELTAIPGELGYIERMVELVGSTRIIYGTDMPWFDEFQGLGGVLSAKISDTDIKNILCDNVERLLGRDW